MHKKGIRISQTPRMQNNQLSIQYGNNKLKGSIMIALIFSVSLLLALLILFVVKQQGIAHQLNQKNKITAIILVVGDNQQMALRSITSFNNQKTQINKIIVGLADINKGIQNKSTNQADYYISKKYPYQLSFIDQLIAQVQTDYFLITTSQWQIQNSLFLKFSKKMMEQFPQISQILPNQFQKLNRDYLLLNWFAFSISPGLHRISDYRKYGNYTQIAIGSTIIDFQAQQKISNYYVSKGLQALIVHKFDIKIIQGGNYLATQSNRRTFGSQSQGNSVPLNGGIGIGIPANIYRRPAVILQRISDYVRQLSFLLKQAPKIYQIQRTNWRYQQLPFCILVFPSQTYPSNKIIDSVSNQNYSNFKIIDIGQNQKNNQQQLNYFFFYKLIKQNCGQNSLVLFLNSPLKHTALKYLNDLHQQNLIWITYSKDQNKTQVFSFYFRIYQLLYKNDFQQANQPYLQNNTISIQTIGMLQICGDASKQIQRYVIIPANQSNYFMVQNNDNTSCTRPQYTPIHRLSEDMRSLGYFMNSKKNDMYSSMGGSQRNQLTRQNMIRAVLRQQQWYLPDQHTIKALQRIDYNEKYKIDDYTQIQKQVRFCITILSHNNIQNDRYIKVIKSIIQQQYQNYNIVFIDDNSTDQNMQATIDYFKQIGFPQQRLTFIQNTQRNYATYNILNAAYNYCHQDDIQMLMDGDDQFIGKYAFQVMNSAYQQNPNLWFVYSNYKTNYFQYGRSISFRAQSHHALNNRRLFISGIGPIRTWRVKLIYNIPIAHHKMEDGNWLDTVYDDALQHPLLELSTVQRVRYIPQILYEYNVRYGDNDDSTAQKVQHRTITYRHIIDLTPLQPLTTLQSSIKDKDVKAALQADYNVTYFIVK